jgi:hypothetical protein
LTGTSEKLQLKEGEPITVVGAPGGFRIDSHRTEGGRGALLVFAVDSAALERNERALVKSALADRLTWVAYPKGGQLGTDLSRDTLVNHLKDLGVQGVRMVSIDDVWSALRLRPAQP